VTYTPRNPNDYAHLKGKALETRLQEGDWALEGGRPESHAQALAECALLANRCTPIESAPTALASLLLEVRALCRDLGVPIHADDGDLLAAVVRARIEVNAISIHLDRAALALRACGIRRFGG
jgi:hypothetical protein